MEREVWYEFEFENLICCYSYCVIGQFLNVDCVKGLGCGDWG